MGVWLGWDSIESIISDLQTSSTSPTPTAVPTREQVVTMPPTTTPIPSPRPTGSPSTNTPIPSYTTKHGNDLPLIDIDVLESTIVSLINNARSIGNLESLVRASSLDDLATAHSRSMANSQRAEARSPDAGCGSSGTQVVQWPQVKSFSYRGPVTAPTTITPTEYDETAKETAGGVVEYVHRDEAPYTKDPHYRYVGVGAVQSPDEHGFMVFWITLYLADCIAEVPTATGTATATPHPSPTPVGTVAMTVTNAPAVMATPSLTPTRTPSPTPTNTPVPTATPTHTPTPTPTNTPVPTATPTPTPTPTPTNTPTPSPTPEPNLADFYNTTNTKWLSRTYPALAHRILAFSWAQDGLSPSEKEIIDSLLYLGVHDIEQLKRVVEMPFLLSLDSTTILAVRSMRKLAQEGLMTEVLNHPQVVSSPEDTWTILIVAAGSLYRTTPGEIDRFLDSAWIEEGVVHTEYIPQLQVSIVRTGESKPGTLEMAFEAVRVVEETMEMPLPVSHAVIVLDDAAVGDDFAGNNQGYAIGLRPEFENPSDSWQWSQFQNALIHEVSHYFWTGSVKWINEGMANIHEYIYNVNHGLSPSQLKPRRNECEAHDLQMLTQWNPEKSNDQFGCNYYMGEVLFLDLLNELGDDTFRNKMRELYALYVSEREAGGKAGIEQIRQVFHNQLDIVEHRWSGKWNAPENRDLTEGIERHSHHLVRWDEYPTFDSASRVVSFKGTLLYDAVLVAPHISIARGGGGQNFPLFPFDSTSLAGWVLPHLEVGRKWVPSEYIHAITTTYELDGRSFHIEFPLPEGLEIPTDYVVVVEGFQNGERTPTIGRNVDNLGYARIRQPDNAEGASN